MGVLAVPVTAVGYLIYQKSQAFSAAPEPTVAAAPAADSEVVAVAPSYADADQLRRKQELDIRRQQEASAVKPEQPAVETRPGGKRVITLGPSAKREEPVPTYEPDPEPAPQRRVAARKPGPQIYQSEEDERDLQAREDGALRQKGIKPDRPTPPEEPLMPFSKSSSSVGSSYGSSGSRRVGSGSRN